MKGARCAWCGRVAPRAGTVAAGAARKRAREAGEQTVRLIYGAGALGRGRPACALAPTLGDPVEYVAGTGCLDGVRAEEAIRVGLAPGGV